MTEQTKQLFNLLIDGKISPSLSSKTFDVVNPSTGEVFAHVADAGLEDVAIAIQSARLAFDYGKWPQMGMTQRGEVLLKIGQMIRERAKDLASLESISTGKTIKHATFIDVPTCAETFEYYGKLVGQLNCETIKVTAPILSQIEHEPVGVVAAIIPSNYPLIMTAWKLAPALLAGNCVLLKPAAEGCAAVMLLAQLLVEAGLPKGAVQIICATDIAVAEALVVDPMVDMISFTGSTITGKHVMAKAANRVKKLTLELGGKSPNIVFADCDFDAAIGGSLSAIFMNGGQMCTAGSRLFVEDKIYDQFVTKLVERAKTLVVGPADSFETEFGPLVTVKQRDRVLKAIESAKVEGAIVVCGGVIPEGLNPKGAFIQPTILTNVKNHMRVAQEEIFGPVLCVIKFTNVDEVVQMANDTPYGLAAMIWSQDLFKANTVARRLRCGTVWINTYGAFINEAPFGGVKQSGFGRELGKQGLCEYSQIKHIATDQTPGGKSLVTAWF